MSGIVEDSYIFWWQRWTYRNILIFLKASWTSAYYQLRQVRLQYPAISVNILKWKPRSTVFKHSTITVNISFRVIESIIHSITMCWFPPPPKCIKLNVHIRIHTYICIHTYVYVYIGNVITNYVKILVTLRV